jgi:RimJ/RimL family protein N-acetyltransferase
VVERWGAALYGDPCRECGWGWPDPAASVEFVARVAQEFAEALAGVDGTVRHPDHAWSVTGYVAHVGDNLRQSAERVAGALAGGTLHVSGYDPDVLAAARGYDHLDLPAALWSLRHSADAWVEVLRAALASDLVLQHAARGEQRAQDVARNNAHDAFHHLHDVRRAVAHHGVTELRTARLLLRGFRRGDADDVHRYASDPEVCRYVAWGPNTPAQTQEFLAAAVGENGDDGVWTWAVTEDGIVIGTVSMTRQSRHRAEVGYVLRRADWGRGITTEAASAVLEFGFDQLGFRRIEATCRPENTGSRRVLEKIGMQREGTLRSHLLLRGELRDSLLFAAVR